MTKEYLMYAGGFVVFLAIVVVSIWKNSKKPVTPFKHLNRHRHVTSSESEEGIVPKSTEE